jgi:hypothetical protein
MYDTLVKKNIVSETDSEPNQAKNKTARRLFADVTLEMERVSTISVEPLPKDSVPVSSYAESQEPGILSQENALQVVDKLIAFHDMGLTGEEVRNGEDFNNHETAARLPQTNVQTGTMQLAKNLGPASLAKKAKIYDWDDDKEDETGGDFFTKNKDLFYNRKRPKSQPPKDKEKTKARNLGHSDSRLVLHARDEVSYESFRKNLFNERDNEGQLLDREIKGVVNTMDNVGTDTQIAVEAIQALVDGSLCRPDLSEGTKRVEEIERERISDDRISEPIASTKCVEETIEKANRIGRKKLMSNEDKLVNNAKKRKVATKGQSVASGKVTGDTRKNSLDIFSNSAPIPRRPRSSKGTNYLGESAASLKSPVPNAPCREKRVFIRSATELLGKAKRQRRVSLLEKQKSSIPCTEINKGSPVFTPKKSHKRALDGGSYRPSVQRELLRLDIGESSVVRKWKDLRIRRDLADARVLLSHHLDEKVIRRQRKVLFEYSFICISQFKRFCYFVLSFKYWQLYL